MQLDDQLFKAAKKYAAEHRLTFTAVVQDALRALLQAGVKSAKSGPFHLPTFKGKGLRPGVDLEDSAALLDLMERHDPPRR
jgi:hypothetical protein